MKYRLSYLSGLVLTLALAGCGYRADLAPVESWNDHSAPPPMAMAAPRPHVVPQAPAPVVAAVTPHPDLAKVEKGDTVDSISRRYNVPVHVIVEANSLTAPYRLEIGSMLFLTAGGAPVATPSREAQAAPPPEPKPIAAAPLRHEKLAAATPSENIGDRAPPPFKHAEPSYAPGVGQSLPPVPAAKPSSASAAPRIDSAEVPPPPPKPTPRVAEAPKPVAASEPPKVAAAEPPAPATGRVPPAERKTPVEPAAAPATVAPQGNERAFIWPVQGKILEGYGSAINGTHNDGINIAAPAGTPVRAAATGTVAYVGNELRGYGNLVLIKHDGGYLTAYAHNGKLMVHRGDHVVRGQAIAKVGATGTVGEPQLHFEIRYGRSAIDPRPLLPETPPDAPAKG